MAAMNKIAKFTSGTKVRKPVVILETSNDAKREIHLGDKNIRNL
jgi:hypothetical protein